MSGKSEMKVKYGEMSACRQQEGGMIREKRARREREREGRRAIEAPRVRNCGSERAVIEIREER